MNFAIAIALLAGLTPSSYYAYPMTENEAIQEYLENLFKSGYNRNVMPVAKEGHGKPLNVRCSFYLIDIDKIDDSSMEYRAHFYFRQSWNDSRLAFLDYDIDTVVLNNPEFIWTPDLFFKQERKGMIHKLIAPNVFIQIFPDGEVLYSLRLSVTFSCPMDFKKYPHDTQKCVFAVQSYGLNRNQIQLIWDNKQVLQAVGYNKYIDMMSFDLEGIQEDTKNLKGSHGEYTVLEIEITFHRKFGYFLIKLYFPFMFLTILSWLSLWIPAKLAVPRLSIILVVIYFTFHIGYDINGFIPQTSYSKGSDIWIAVCEAYVFAAFLEFVVVFIISSHEEKLKAKLLKNDIEVFIVLECDEKGNQSSDYISSFVRNTLEYNLKVGNLLSSRIDKACKIWFPIFFVIFNFIYGIVYAMEL